MKKTKQRVKPEFFTIPLAGGREDQILLCCWRQGCGTAASMAQDLDPWLGSVEQPVLQSLHSQNCLNVSLYESHREYLVLCLNKGDFECLFVGGGGGSGL